MSERTIKCGICGKPYVVYMFHAGDQSTCPTCRSEARKNLGKAPSETDFRIVIK